MRRSAPRPGIIVGADVVCAPTRRCVANTAANTGPRPDAGDEEDRVAVQLDPQLMDILACPSEDHAPLRAGTPTDPEADVLTCTECGRGFPVVDGIPVLLLDEAIPPPAAGSGGA
jgi:uncharacterized protein YbaR (Trm112 family)